MIGSTRSSSIMRGETRVREARIAIVGAGFRATSFLTSDARLLDQDIVLVEQSPTIASTAFAEYDATTTSIGSKFFQYVDYRGPLQRLRQNEDYRRVADAAHPVDMRDLAKALDAVGTLLREELGSALIPNTRIESVEVKSRRVTLRSSRGEVVRARHVVLATGRREVVLEELDPYREKVELSGEFIRHTNRLVSRIHRGDFASGPVVILGSSHSAMAVLQRLLTARESASAIEIVLLQRSPARLMYPTLEQAREHHVAGRELRADKRVHVCPATGIVFRDSGLRGLSRELYIRLWETRVPGAHLVQAPLPATKRSILERASVIVQATGYRPEHPAVSVDRLGQGKDAKTATFDMSQDVTASIDGQKIDEISLLRLGQTPSALRDHADFGASLYRDLREKLVAV